MSGVSAVRYILANNGALVAVVPAAKIFAGVIPLNTVLPAIAVTQISGVPTLTVAMTEPGQIQTERVQVTALVKGPQATPSGLGYPGQKALMRLVLAALPNQSGTINTIKVDSIIPDGEGPDLFDDASGVYEQSRDFIVRWHTP